MSQCDGCHAGCCRSFAVPITGADVLRIERDLGLDFWDFACRWADPDGKIARGRAPHLFFDDEPRTPFVLGLRHVASGDHPGTTMCRFLVESPPDAGHPNGVARCGVYRSRPMACRCFPTKFDATGHLAVIHDVPARGRPQNHPAYSLCPRPWRPDEFDPLQAPQDLAVAKYETEFFRSIAGTWNRVPRPFGDFPEYLRLVYGNRVLREPGGPAARGSEPAGGPASLPIAADRRVA